MSDVFSNPLVVGGASAGILFYLVTNVMQAIGIWKLCEKLGFKRLRQALLTVIVIIPFGVEVSLLIIAYDKKRTRRPTQAK
ncbi:MAG: hypothetical protein FWF11_00300 [Coriobacteriia bacterium]|nr:hypothetical protein [Coriobacteriia bacterium]